MSFLSCVRQRPPRLPRKAEAVRDRHAVAGDSHRRPHQVLQPTGLARSLHVGVITRGGNTMRQRRLMRYVAVASITLVTLVGVLSGLVGADGPDFSNVTDILGGQRHLLRNDDLVLDVAPALTLNPFLSQGLNITAGPPFDFESSNCPGVLQSRVGRLFNTPRDSIVTLAGTASAGPGCTGGSNLALYIHDPEDRSNKSQTDLTTNANFSQIALADFNGDGYADIIFLNQGSASVLTAQNPNDASQGLAFGPPLVLPDDYAPQGTPVSGDFNGDGVVDVAWPVIFNELWAVAVASVCPAAGVTVLGQTCSQALQIILSPHTILNLGDPGLAPSAPSLPLAAGDYDGVPNAQGHPTHELAVDGLDHNGFTLLSVYSFDATLTPTLRSSTRSSIASGLNLSVVASGRLGWFGQQDQLVYASSTNGFNPRDGIISNLVVITFDTNLNMTLHQATLPGFDSNHFVYPFGLAVGRFDPPDVNGTRNPNLQIAVLAVRGRFPLPPSPPPMFQTLLHVFTVEPSSNNFTPQLASTFVVANDTLYPGYIDPSFGNVVHIPYGNPLSAGDLQGRSLPLGTPTKVTVTGSIQPQVVLGLPPMHVDYICDANNTGTGCTPTALNLSALPSKYYSQYQTQQSSSNQSANTNTTGYTFATKESAEAKFSYGVPLVASVSVDLKTSAQQTHQNTVSDKYNTYASKQFDVSTQTGFSDLVWYTIKRFNLYYYPVLGQLVCPQSQPTCSDAQKVPLHVVFSGPDQIMQIRIDGNQLEWYQPVQESGNVFSYPWNITQLQNLYAGFNALTEDPATVWATDSSASTVSTTWSEGAGSSVTSGSVSTQAFDVSVSIASKINIGGFGADLSGGFDYNSSSSVSTLNESSSKLGSSTGIKIVKPSFVNPGQYAYTAQTYIFGQQAPTGTVQEIPLDTTVQSSGPLWTAFLVDPTDTPNGAGGWWAQAYTKPDVALNHPLRWTWTPPTPSEGDVMTFNPPIAPLLRAASSTL